MPTDPTRITGDSAPEFPSVRWQTRLEDTMRLILNIIWLVFGGLWLALGYLLAALICFLLIVTIPFGFASLRIASYALWPFGRTIVDRPGKRTGAVIGNVIWILVCGIWLAIGHLVSAVAMALTIVGLPLALANLKLIPVSLVPLGKEIVPVHQQTPLARPGTVRS
jgi:uncharacterized membrane protein YccF (DUF307 family)